MTGRSAESWWVGVTELDGRLCLLRVASNVEPLPGFDTRLQVQARFDSDRADGMPEGEIRGQLDQLEDDLSATAGERAILVGVVTASGERRYHLHAASDDWWSDSVRALVPTYPDLKVLHGASGDPNWQFYAQLARQGMTGGRQPMRERTDGKSVHLWGAARP